MDTVGWRLLDEYQHGLPLTPQPFLHIGRQLGVAEDEVIARLAAWQEDGTVSRVGAVFAPNTVGAGTLAAMTVPEERLMAVAGILSAYPGVNHNYRREHRINLWFVATAPDTTALAHLLADIESRTELPVMALPLEREYHIDLGFPLRGGRAAHARPPAPGSAGSLVAAHARLIAALEPGLALVPHPFAALGRTTGLDETAVLSALEALVAAGVIRRLGVVVRHRELGWSANAMAVWDVPDAAVDRIGATLAREAAVTLCYRRARHPPQWPYNLYTMVHGRARGEVEGQLAALTRQHGLDRFPAAVLFSTERFKQRGARYATGAARG